MFDAEASQSPLIGIWFCNSAGWDRGIDHAATEEEARKDKDGRTLCGRRLGRRFVFSGDSFDSSASYSCSQCRAVVKREAREEVHV